MFKVNNNHRMRSHPTLYSNDSDGNNGYFMFPLKGFEVHCVASDGEGWEHVSVTFGGESTPSWEIMCFVKEQFWSDEDTVIQFHPKKSEHVNFHSYCLHLWRKSGVNQELPPSIMIGPKG